MPRARATASSRLTVDDWIQAGHTILAEKGIKALKIDRLCSHLAVTKGSFYCHFSDMPGYRGAHRGLGRIARRRPPTFAAGIGFLHLAARRPAPWPRRATSASWRSC